MGEGVNVNVVVKGLLRLKKITVRIKTRMAPSARGSRGILSCEIKVMFGETNRFRLGKRRVS